MTTFEGLSPYTYAVFILQFGGYIAFSLFLQYSFYYLRPKDKNKWKIQAKVPTVAVGRLWGHPIISNKPQRGKYHGVFALINLCLASAFVAATTECAVKGWNKMQFDAVGTSYQVCLIVGQFVWAVIWQCVVEYYWHRLMHLPYFYKAFHKFHHHYKAPEPWDDMYIHPLEAFGYYCILYSPPFLFPTHLYAFLAYMAVMGTCGVLDHSGIRLRLPGVYDTAEHDRHHEKYEVNYSFPFPHMDILHGTFDGEFWGKTYKPTRRS